METSRALFNRVVIVGPGLIGGSLGMALRARRLAGRVIGVGRRKESLDQALAAGALDEASLNLEEACRTADLVVLAAGVGAIPLQASLLLPTMKSSAVLTDVGSVKGVICHAVRQAFDGCSESRPSFIGGHPLAGSEQRGVAAARPDLFDRALCILTPTPHTDPTGLAARSVRALWEAVGCRVREMTPHEHDSLVAQSSHLPHLAAAALVNALRDPAIEIAASGFRDTTRVASGDPALWVEICLANRQPLLEALDALGDELRDFANALDTSDGDALLKLLQRAKQRRDTRLGNGGATPAPAGPSAEG